MNEVAWCKGQNYLTLVSSHTCAQVVWGAQGRDAATLDGFFTELGPERSEEIQAVSMDMSTRYQKSVRTPEHARRQRSVSIHSMWSPWPGAAAAVAAYISPLTALAADAG